MRSVTRTAVTANAWRCTSSAPERARFSMRSPFHRARPRCWSTCGTTKGHPTVAANNHPIRHGAVVGIHNGIIFNDDELLAGHDCARREPGMTVDSEAIFAVAAHSDADPQALEALCGSMATAWLDERRERSLFVARGVGRPLWISSGDEGLFFASTKLALEVLESYLKLDLAKRELEE